MPENVTIGQVRMARWGATLLAFMVAGLVCLTCQAGAAAQNRIPRVRREEGVYPFHRGVVRRVLGRAREEIRACLPLSSKRSHIVINFEIQLASGGTLSLRGANLPPEHQGPDTFACLSRVVASLRHPQPDLGLTATFQIPMNLRPVL